MIYAISIAAVLCLLDLLLLKVMPKFYFSIGVPIYKGTVEIKKDKTLNDIGTYVGISENLVYKIRNSKLLFRTKFTYSNLYRIGVLSIIKGEIKLIEGKARIIQRMNLTTLYIALLMIFILITEKIDMIGYIILVVLFLITIVFHLAKNGQIEEIRKDIETSLNEDKKKSLSSWGD